MAKMADVMTVEQRRSVMSRIRGKDTVPERCLKALLDAAGFSVVQHDKSLPGTPDFVFVDERLVVFVDGDFWHGWRFPRWCHRLAPFWREKIQKNRVRDQRNFRRLRSAGWTVLRIWEHQIEENCRKCIFRIAARVGATVDRSAVDRCFTMLPVLKRRKRLPRP